MFYTVHILQKYLHVITAVINFCNYINNYSIDPSLTPNPPLNLTIPPNLS